MTQTVGVDPRAECQWAIPPLYRRFALDIFRAYGPEGVEELLERTRAEAALQVATRTKRELLAVNAALDYLLFRGLGTTTPTPHLWRFVTGAEQLGQGDQVMINGRPGKALATSGSILTWYATGESRRLPRYATVGVDCILRSR